MQLVFVLDIIK